MWASKCNYSMTAREIIQSLLQAKLELQDDKLHEQFWFTDGSRVVATLGTKDGAVCGPVLGYQIRNDEVEIGNAGESLFYKWKNLQLLDNTLVVFCDGMTKRFAITRPPPKKERWLP